MLTMTAGTHTDTRAVPEDELTMAAQTVFSVLDFFSHWARFTQRGNQRASTSSHRRHIDTDAAERLSFAESFLTAMPMDVIARAAYRCRDFPRALLNLETFIKATCPFLNSPNGLADAEKGAPAQHAGNTRADGTGDAAVEADKARREHYLLLQKIYNELGDTDGMSGLASKRTHTSLPEKILDHRSSGEWTHALSCYEKAVQSNKQALAYQEGLLQCQMKLGHLETTITHATGIIASSHNEWQAELNRYRVQSAWKLGDWESLDAFLRVPSRPSFEISLGRSIQSAQHRHLSRFGDVVEATRADVLRNLSAGSTEFGSYERSYDYMLQLHMLRDLEHAMLPILQQFCTVPVAPPSAADASADTAVIDNVTSWLTVSADSHHCVAGHPTRPIHPAILISSVQNLGSCFYYAPHPFLNDGDVGQ